MCVCVGGVTWICVCACYTVDGDCMCKALSEETRLLTRLPTEKSEVTLTDVWRDFIGGNARKAISTCRLRGVQ